MFITTSDTYINSEHNMTRELTPRDIKLLRDPETRKHWVRYQLFLQGTTMSKLAQANGITRTCLYTVWRRTYPKMEKLIANALGLEPHQMFPERYQSNGLPIYRMGPPSKNRKPAKSVRKNINKRHAERNGSAMGVA